MEHDWDKIREFHIPVDESETQKRLSKSIKQMGAAVCVFVCVCASVCVRLRVCVCVCVGGWGSVQTIHIVQVSATL